MKLTACLYRDDDDRLYAALTRGDDVLAVITADDDLCRPFREQLKAWAAENGHEITHFETEGLL